MPIDSNASFQCVQKWMECYLCVALTLVDWAKKKKLLTYCLCVACLAGSSLRVVVAAGPFSTSDDLQYDPLQALLEKIRHDRPDVCILVSNCS